MSRRAAICWWAVSRFALLVYWAVLKPGMVGDVVYYHRELGDLFAMGLGESLIEYPTPVVGLLLIPWLLGGGNLYLYVAFFVIAMLLLDFGLFWWFLRRGEMAAVRYWIWAIVLMGPLVYLRFDLLTAFLAGAALLTMARRPALAGALTGLGAAVKLWPALLAPALWSRHRIRTTVGLFGCGGLLALVSLILGGWDRLVSPLTWQSDRGLQVESVWATLPMAARLWALPDHPVIFSNHNAYEVTGQWVSTMVTVADVSMLAGLALIAALGVLAWRRGEFTLHTAAMIMITVTLVMIITNKTFSPQYLVWLLAPAAVLQFGGATTIHRRIGLVVLVLTALTQLVYPAFYDALIFDDQHIALRVIGTVILVLRNVGIIVATVWVAQLTVRALTRRHDVTS